MVNLRRRPPPAAYKALSSNCCFRFPDSLGCSCRHRHECLADHLLVGAPNADLNGKQYVGEAYLFDAATGGLLRTFANPEPAFLAQFGSSVALVGDLAVVGAPGTNINPSPPGANAAGAFYVFDVNSGNYLAKFLSPTPSQNMFFTGGGGQNGGLVAIGNRLVAATELQPVNGLFNAGQVYVYQAIPEPSGVLLTLPVAFTMAARLRFRRFPSSAIVA